MESPSSSPNSRGCENEALDVPRQNGGHSHQHHPHRSTRRKTPSTTMTTLTSKHCRDFVTSISPKGCKHNTNLSVVVMQPPPASIPTSNDFVRSDSSTQGKYIF